MPRTIESIMESHRLASERRAAGRPVWDEEIRFPRWTVDPDRPFEERRDAVVAALQASAWFKREGEDSPLARDVEDLADAYDYEEFADAIDDIYDRANVCRIWLTVEPR